MEERLVVRGWHQARRVVRPMDHMSASQFPTSLAVSPSRVPEPLELDFFCGGEDVVVEETFEIVI